jgi:tetratricopeptide (TPR) repeat protein
MEGFTVRRIWITPVAVAGLVLTSAGVASAWPFVGASSPQPAPGPQAFAPNGVPSAHGQPQQTWTQKLTAPFKSSPPAIAHNQPDPAAIARRQQMDPISLGYDASPGSPQLYVAMAEMSHRGGNIPQARELYKKALAAQPKNVDALLGAARMEDREGQMDTALGLYQRAVAAQPQNPTALNDLALCLARKGDLPSAYRALKDTINLDAKKPLYRNNMAKVLIEMNRMDEAAWNLAAVHPPAVVQYNMGVLLAQRGRNAESVEFLSRAVAIDPNMQPARALLAQMTTPAAPVAANTAQEPVIRTAQAPATAATEPAAKPEAAPAATPTLPQAGAGVTDDSILPTPATPAETPAAPQAGAAAAQPAATAAPAPTAVGGAAAPSTTPLAVLPSRLPTVY